MRMREDEIEKLRGLVRNCVRKRLYSSPIFFFFVDNVAASTEDPADTLHLSWTQFYLLNASNIVLRDPPFCYPAAICPTSYVLGFDYLGIILVDSIYVVVFLWKLGCCDGVQTLWLQSDGQFCTEMSSLALMDECQNGIDPKEDRLAR
ncbi:unnamed protein product [Citrullus colocynthis]|uniref:Uncharacterized protein n=1 Tax=Citrullus colocynthis TaxID=252529 RepID=A0ABP0Z128_9ROSI